jgi:hypothetical protein
LENSGGQHKMQNTNLNFNNLSQLDINLTGLSSPISATNEIIATATQEVGALWFNLPIFIIFLVLVWYIYREEGFFNYDITRSCLISSSFCLFISISFILSGLVNSIVAIVWFSTIFAVTFIVTMKLKEKNI